MPRGTPNTRPEKEVRLRDHLPEEQSQENDYEHDGAEHISPDNDYTIVPEQFTRMPDEVLAVAMQAYQGSLDKGRSEVIAITDGVIAAKNWARANGKDYRK